MDPNVTNETDWTVLMNSANNGDIATLKTLLDYGIRIALVHAMAEPPNPFDRKKLSGDRPVAQTGWGNEIIGGSEYFFAVPNILYSD